LSSAPAATSGRVAVSGSGSALGAYPRERRTTKPRRTTESSQRRWIGNPQVELELALARRAKLADPLANLRRRIEERAIRPHAACVGNRNGQRHRTGSRHWCQQNRKVEAIGRAEGAGAIERALAVHASIFARSGSRGSPHHRGPDKSMVGPDVLLDNHSGRMDVLVDAEQVGRVVLTFDLREATVVVPECRLHPLLAFLHHEVDVGATR